MATLNETISCVKSGHSVFCGDDNKEYVEPEEHLSVEHYMFWVFLGAYLAVVLFAGLMSGLTLAIFSLDLTSLKVLQMAGSPQDIKYASRIMPLVQRQYLVLVSLVLANSLAVEAMPLLLDTIAPFYIALGVSVSLVLIFGEVLPQAVCGRYGLVIGYYFAWLVWTLIAILFIVAYPVSKVLECLLGENHGTFYRRSELKALVAIHGPTIERKRKGKNKKKSVSPADIEEAQRIAAERLTLDEVLIIKGALELGSKQAKLAMIKLENVYMLSINDHIDGKKLQEILDIGHSRIPIYENNRQNIKGVLLTKRLITADPNKHTPVKDFIGDSRYYYRPFYVNSTVSLYVLLNTFQEGTSTHIAFVREKQPDSSFQILGVITLEDIIEELLMEEIQDEQDIIRNVNKRIQLARATAFRAKSPTSSPKKSHEVKRTAKSKDKTSKSPNKV